MTLTLLSLLALTLTSCVGDTGALGAEGPSDQPTSVPAATHPDENADIVVGPAGPDQAETPTMIPTLVQESPELVFEHLSTWEQRPTPSETQLKLAFYSGNPACYGVRAVVEQDEEEVRIATISGTLPDAVDSACTQEARYVALVIELEEPLGEREVVPLTEVDLVR